MSLHYLSGVGELGRNRPRKQKRQEKRQARKVRKGKAPAQESESENEEVSPVTQSRIKKLKVTQRIRKTFKKKKEPLTVEESELTSETETPESETPENSEVEQTEQTEQSENEDSSLGIIYPGVHRYHRSRKNVKNYHSKSIGKLKLKGKLKAKVKKAIDRRKNDKHTPSQKAAHMFAKQAMLVPRGAFLTILLLGKALEHTPIKINLAKRIKDQWSTKGKQIQEFWYKLGGEPDILKAQIEKATSSKLSGELGYVVAATTGASITAASPIVIKIMKLVGKGVDFAKKNPKLIAAGQQIAKKGIEKAAAKGKTADKYNKISALATEITSVLPPETQAKINEIRKNLPDKLVKGVEVKAEKEISDTKAAINDETPASTSETSSNKNMMIGLGVVALGVGGYMLSKKKK